MNEHDRSIREAKSIGMVYGTDPSAPAPPKTFTPLTDEEQRTFDFLRASCASIEPNARPRLFRVRKDGRDRALMAVVWMQGDELVVTPIGLLLSEDEHAALDTPEVPDVSR